MCSNHNFLKCFFLPYSYKRCIHCKKKKFFKLVYRCKKCEAIIHKKCYKHSQQETEKIITTEIEKNKTTQKKETAIINISQANNVTDLIGNEFELETQNDEKKSNLPILSHEHSQQQTEKIITEIEKNKTTQEKETAIINISQANNVTDLIGNEFELKTQNDEKKSNLPILSHEDPLEKRIEKDIPVINLTKETESIENSLDYSIKETTSTIKKIDTSCLLPLTNDRPTVRNVSSRLLNMNMTDQMAVKQNRSLFEKYGIPLADIDFDYVKTCNDPKILKRIIKILESGEEGFYPALLRETETRLRQIKPDASILNRKLCFAQKSSGLSVNEDYGDELNDVANWIKKSNQQEKELSSVRKNSKSFMNGHSEPPVRRSIDLTSMFNSEKSEQELSMHKKTSVKHEPLEASYSKWDKYDPDVEIMKLDNKEKIDKLQAHKKKNINPNCLSVGLNDSKSFNDRVKSMNNYVDEMSKCGTFKPQDLAMREKELGNECFKSNDYEEAIFHYNTSISIHSTPEARNNRAMSFIKLKKHEKALDDLREVIESDSKNIKAHYRRGSCYKAISMYCLALRSFESTLKYDCNNVNALNSVKELRNTIKNIDRKKLIKVREITRHYDGSVWDIEDIFYVSYMELSELVKNKIEHVYEADSIGCIAHCVCDLCPWHEWLQRHKKWGRHKMFKNEVPRKRWQFLTSDIVPKLLSTSLTLETQKPKKLNVTEINSAKVNGHHNSMKISNNEINSTKINGHYNSTNINGHEINEIDKSPCKNCDDKINMKPVSNVQQFLQIWKVASQKNNYELYHKLLRSIKPNDLPRVIGSNLDEEIMSKFLETLNQKFDRNCELDLIIEYLTAMTKVNRFNLIVKMLDNKVKEDIQPLIDCVHLYKNNNLFSSLL